MGDMTILIIDAITGEIEERPMNEQELADRPNVAALSVPLPGAPE